MTAPSDNAVLEDLVADLHQRDRLRVWSIIITLFGDAIVPRGGEVWLGSLLAICARLGIEAGSVRAAMSRLAQDGWVIRERVGRKSYYRLANAGSEAFENASRRIYAPVRCDWDGNWSILIVSEAAGEARDARRGALRALGFGAVAPTIFIRPEAPASQPFSDLSDGDFLFTARLREAGDLSVLGRMSWNLDVLAADYRQFEALYADLHGLAMRGDALDPLEAMALRTMLIHDFRRIVLRDPMLPDQVLGADWIGYSVRRKVAEIYHFLIGYSEIWLEEAAEPNHGIKENSIESIAHRLRV